MSPSKLILIDGNAIIHRAYHAMPALTTPRGQPIGAVQGFVNILLRIIQDLSPTHIAVAWDRKEPTFRHKEFKAYQAQRAEVDKELISQFQKVRDVLDAFDIKQFDKAGFEADDIIGTLSRKALGTRQKALDKVVIVTGDKDQLQLVNDKVKVYMPVKGLGEAILMGEKEVEDKLNVKPEQVVDLKAFMGDPSDNYPGIYGIGPKTAEKLLKLYGNYENVFKHIDDVDEKTAEKLKKGKKDGDISYKLAQIITNVPLEYKTNDFAKWSIYSNKVLDVFDRFGFRTLKKRVEELGSKMAEDKQGKLF